MMADEEWCISKYIPIKKHYEVAYYFTNDNMADQSQLHPTTINKKAIDYLWGMIVKAILCISIEMR